MPNHYKNCMVSELDIFEQDLIQTSILGCEEISLKPVGTLDNCSNLEFLCVSHPNHYLDLSSACLRLKVQIVKNNGGLYLDSDTAQPGPTNNLLHTLFRQCSVYLNSKLATTCTNYHYQSYITQLLSFNKDAVSSHKGEISGFLLDDASQYDSLTTNTALATRKAWFKNSQPVELMGRMHTGLFNLPRFLPSQIDLRLVLTLEKPEFYLMEVDTGVGQIKILEAAMYINRHAISTDILMAHHTLLNRSNAKFFFKHTEIKSFTIPSGNNNISIENIFLGKLPSFVAICFLDNASYNGKRNKNPFNFLNLGMNSFSLFVNNTRIPNDPLEMDFSSNHLCSRAYYSLFKALNINDEDRGLQISQKQFAHGSFILAFDLSPNSDSNRSCSSLLSQGSIRLEARLNTALTKTITCLVLGQFDSILEVDNTHTVYTSI
jgi:hypothetical protein